MSLLDTINAAANLSAKISLTENQRILKTVFYPALLNETEKFMITSSSFSEANELTIKLPYRWDARVVNLTINFIPSTSRKQVIDMEIYVFFEKRKNKYNVRIDAHTALISEVVDNQIRIALANFFGAPAQPVKSLSKLESSRLGNYPLMNKLRPEQKYIMSHIFEYTDQTKSSVEEGISYLELNRMLYERSKMSDLYTSPLKIFNLPRRFGKTTITMSLIEKFLLEEKKLNIYPGLGSNVQTQANILLKSGQKPTIDPRRTKILKCISDVWLNMRDGSKSDPYEIFISSLELIRSPNLRFSIDDHQDVTVYFDNGSLTQSRRYRKDWVSSMEEVMEVISSILELSVHCPAEEATKKNPTVQFRQIYDLMQRSNLDWNIYDDSITTLKELELIESQLGNHIVLTTIENSEELVKIKKFISERPIFYLEF